MAKAPVLKTGGRKPLEVRILCPPLQLARGGIGGPPLVSPGVSPGGGGEQGDAGLAIPEVDDRVAAEHRVRLPAAELHDDVLRHAGADEVAGGGPPKIVHEPPDEVRPHDASERSLPRMGGPIDGAVPA